MSPVCRTLVALATLVLSAAANADGVELVERANARPAIEVHYTGVSINTRTITNVIAYEEFVIVQFVPAVTESDTGCEKGNQVYLDMRDEIGNPIYAAVMTAATSGRTVNLKILQGLCHDTWDAAQLYQVNVKF